MVTLYIRQKIVWVNLETYQLRLSSFSRTILINPIGLGNGAGRSRQKCRNIQSAFVDS
jgi:hypothetical protein